MTDQSSFEELITSLPLLEDLTIDNSYHKSGLEHLTISNQHLKSLKLRKMNEESDMIKVVTIKSVPNLVSFCYKGNINCNISIESTNLLNGEFVISDHHHKYDTNWFMSMLSFFMNLNCSWNIVTLRLSDKALVMPDNCKRLCRSPLAKWKHVRVITRSYIGIASRLVMGCLARKLSLKDVVMWILPSMETLSFNGKDIC
ncbi:hypothetical protein CsatB_006525 [Cannabis sativa]